MANENKVASSSTTGAATAASQPAARNRKVERRTFQHKMTEGEKYALDIVRKAKNGLTQVALMIQEGDGCDPELLAVCSNVITMTGRMLFRE